MASESPHLNRQPPSETPEISIVVPVYFNEGSLVELHRRLAAAMASASARSWDITFVDDDSGDRSEEVLREIQRAHAGVRVVRLSRNFGSAAAIQAGLQHAYGDCVIVISADLQDPPEMLPAMIQRWREGVKVVLATRISRDDPFVSRVLSSLFYRVFRLVVTKDMPPGGFDFFVLDRVVARILAETSEKNTNLAAAILWLGFKREFIPYHRAARVHGRSMWTLAKKITYMYDSMLSFSYLPLRAMTLFGLLGMALAFIYAIVVLAHRLERPHEAPGWASLMVVNLFFSGMMLTAIGTVGEYVWRTFDASRKRPVFVVAEQLEPPIPRTAGGDQERLQEVRRSSR
jgi:dolichol-phosphate mannosyltransferase